MSACSVSHSSELGKPTLNSTPKPPVIDLPVIKVNGQLIDETLFSNEIQYHSAENMAAAIQKAGQALVVRELLRQASGGEIKDDEAKGDEVKELAFEELLEANVDYEPVLDSDCQRYYEQNQEKFQTAPILQVSHILLAAAPEDVEERINKQKLASELLEKLAKQPQLFQEFVAEFSECPSKETQGSLGQVSTGQTVAEFERQLLTLPEGLHSKAIESRYGYHIVDVHKRIDGKQLPLSMVSDRIQRYLDHRRYRQAIADYLYGLSADADIDGIELALDEPNIVFA